LVAGKLSRRGPSYNHDAHFFTRSARSIRYIRARKHSPQKKGAGECASTADY
jgi:hypothetical protein